MGCKLFAGSDAVYEELRQAIRLARTLPTALREVFRQRTRQMPNGTEIERLAIQRVGQDLFRAGLLDYASGRCMLTGVSLPAFLRASQIKPWKDSDDAERMDVFNGLLLAVQWDAAFDQGFVSFTDDGVVLVSRHLPPDEASRLGLDWGLRVEGLRAGHKPYLAWHRERVFA